MQIVPLSADPSQLISIVLSGQAASISIYQLGFPPNADLYIDLTSNGTAIVNTRKCRSYGGSATEAAPFLLLTGQYLGFQGDFLFVDTEGDEDPQYAGLGTRWQLIYYTAAEVVAIS